MKSAVGAAVCFAVGAAASGSGKARDLDVFVLGLLELSPGSKSAFQNGIAKAKQESYATMLGELETTVENVGEFIEGHTEDDGDLSKQTQTYDGFARMNFDTICETGFNAGHSALRFLAQSQANLYEFDLGEHKYSKVAAEFLHGKFGSRLHNTWGDSTKSLPKFHAEQPDVKCNLVIVDGGHMFDVALADLTNFGQMASSEHVLVIDDTPCDEYYCEGPKKAWKQLIDEGCVQESHGYSMGHARGFSVGRYTACPRWPSQKEALVVPGENSALQLKAEVAKPKAAGMYRADSELQMSSRLQRKSSSAVFLHHRRQRLHLNSAICRPLPLLQRAACEKKVDAQVLHEKSWKRFNATVKPSATTLALDHD